MGSSQLPDWFLKRSCHNAFVPGVYRCIIWSLYVSLFFTVNEEWLEGHCAGNIGIFPSSFAMRENENVMPLSDFSNWTIMNNTLSEGRSVSKEASRQPCKLLNSTFYLLFYFMDLTTSRRVRVSFSKFCSLCFCVFITHKTALLHSWRALKDYYSCGPCQSFLSRVRRRRRGKQAGWWYDAGTFIPLLPNHVHNSNTVLKSHMWMSSPIATLTWKGITHSKTNFKGHWTE